MYAVARKQVSSLKDWCQCFKYFAVFSITGALFTSEIHYAQVLFTLLALSSMWSEVFGMALKEIASKHQSPRTCTQTEDNFPS